MASRAVQVVGLAFEKSSSCQVSSRLGYKEAGSTLVGEGSSTKDCSIAWRGGSYALGEVPRLGEIAGRRSNNNEQRLALLVPHVPGSPNHNFDCAVRRMAVCSG